MTTVPSRIYRRLLRGEVTPEHYVRVIKRHVDMRLRFDRLGRPERRNSDAKPQKGQVICRK